jgi:5-oxoprolinase (ATP-hydrolysing) subunit A
LVRTIDLNADVGEATSSADDERALLQLVSSINVACGFHAGDPGVMRRVVMTAASLGVAIGAHPSYPDRSGFGRRFIDCTHEEIVADLLYQVGALAAFCRAAGVPLRHVKPHGALYNHAAIDAATAGAIVAAVRLFDPTLALVAPADSILHRAGFEAGLHVLAEAFADRGYRPDGTLVPRRQPRALIDAPDEAAARALRIAREGAVDAVDGSTIPMHADTICLHSDAPGAVERARAIRALLVASGVPVAAPERPLPLPG